MEDERDGARARARAGAAETRDTEDRRAETVRRFVTVTRALASSGGECEERTRELISRIYSSAASLLPTFIPSIVRACVRAYRAFGERFVRSVSK